MRTLRIGCDVDDVVLEYVATLTAFYNKMYDGDVKLDDIKVWDLKTAYEKAGTPEATRALMEAFIQHPSFMQMPEVPGSVPTITRLAEEGHEIFFISARGSKAIDSAYKWFYAHSLPLRNMYFNREKAWLVDKLGIDVFVDDGVHNLEAIAERNPHVETILFSRPWNETAVTRYAHHRAKDWVQVRRIITECV